MQSIDLSTGSKSRPKFGSESESEPSTLESQSTILLNETIKHIFKSKKTTVITGAGISCNAGIPDFRSDDGLYNMVKHKYPKSIVRGQDLFDINLFRDDVSLSIFCTFMEGLYLSTLSARPTETHKFLKHLKDRGKLLRCYTQNIDSLEKEVDLKMGIDKNEFELGRFKENWQKLDVVQLHGNLHKLSCTRCFASFEWNEKYQMMLNEGNTPECQNCHKQYMDRLYLGKRLTGQIGVLRPDIVLYGENHPQSEIISQGLNTDLRSKPDCLIIMGTSLKVDGVKKLVKSLSNEVHKKGGKVIFINKTKLSKSWEKFIDYEVLCDCDEFVRILKRTVPDLFLTQEQIDSKKLKNKAEQVFISREKANDVIGAIGVKQEYNGITIKTEESLGPEIKQEIKVKVEPGLESTESPLGKVIKTEILTPPTTPSKPKPVLRKRPRQQQQQQQKQKQKPKQNEEQERNQELEQQQKQQRPTLTRKDQRVNSPLLDTDDIENRTKRLKGNEEFPTPVSSFDDLIPLQSYTMLQLNRIKIEKLILS